MRVKHLMRCFNPQMKNSAEYGSVLVHIETGTGFWLVEVVVAHDESTGELLAQADQQVEQGVSLGFCPSVGWLAIFVQASFVADADGVGIVEPAVGSNFFQGSAFVQGAVTLHVVVVADVLETTVLDVIALAGFETVALISSGGWTVQDD